MDNFSELHGTWTSPVRKYRRARCVKASCRVITKMADFWEFGSLRISEQGPGIQQRDASSTENGGLPGVWEFELDKFVPRAPGRLESYPQVINSYWGVWEFKSLTRSRSTSLPSYNPGTENTLFSPRSLVLQP